MWHCGKNWRGRGGEGRGPLVSYAGDAGVKRVRVWSSQGYVSFGYDTDDWVVRGVMSEDFDYKSFVFLPPSSDRMSHPPSFEGACAALSLAQDEAH
ncbi:hypothetical protein C0Q70_14372 [Pomacea canaliculata]|uniref:Uncharacterized protein n=1 Tax=Pomacea canaliculata TaxID=400727 RepID=A0A2T7NZU9_POMCA|nr:hypothetical protein C0Q70_14372 [Pomacea canaliculata]